MPLAWVPYTGHDEAERRLGPIPAGLDLDFYLADGDALPASVAEVAFYVLPVHEGGRCPGAGRGHAQAPGRADPHRRLRRIPAAGCLPTATLCNASGLHDASTAELAVALALASGRHLDSYARNQSTGTWSQIWPHSLTSAS